MSEICLILVAEEPEFAVERAIVHELIYPTLRRFFMAEFQIEFNIIDFYQDSNCKNVPNIDKTDLMLSEMKKAQNISRGLSSLILLGDQCGQLRAPRKLTSNQFNHILDFLQSKKDPVWKTISSKYVKSKTNDDYLLDEKISDEENYSILNSIDSSIASKPSDLFPEKFVSDHLTTLLEKSVAIATLDRATISTTQIIRRNVTNSYETQKTPPRPETIFEKNLNEKYENLIKATRRKCLPNNFLEYTISNMTLLEAQRELRKRKTKLFEISENWNFLSGKNRSLARDIRVSSTMDFYLQVFLDHVCKIIRETSVNLLLKRDISKDPIAVEIVSHRLHIDKVVDGDLSAMINKERDREKGIFQNYFNSASAKMPGLIYGPVGSGKTTLLLDLWEKSAQKSTVMAIIRHCGKTVGSSNLQLLICSISDQINSSLAKKTIISNACEYAVCVYDFWTSLNKASATRPIIIFLDDVENLYPNSHTDMVKWLPPSLPNGVKVILASSSESFYQGFKKRYEVSNIINLTKLDPKDCIRLLPNLCGKTSENSSIPVSVFDQANVCVQENSTPLYLDILSRSLDFMKESDQLTSDFKSVFKLYLDKLQCTPNNLIIKHILSYLSLSRFGLSIAELTDLLSLDNRMLALLSFSIDAKVIFKFPVYLTVYYLSLLADITTTILASGKLLIRLKHQVFTTLIFDYFQLSQDDGKFFYQTLFDYWTSKYSGEKLKPTFDKTSDDNEDETGTDGSHLYVKRAVASQPYYTIGKDRIFVSNQRKLLELPSLLIKFDKVQELYRFVVFNFEFLFASLHFFGINHLISELYFTRQINEIKNNAELELLLAQLRLLSPEVLTDARLLAPELSGRLCHLINTNALLSQLHHHIDTCGTKINAIFAAVPSYSTIDIENMRVEIGVNKELLFSSLSPDNRFISAFIRDVLTQEFLITVWDSKSATKSQIINLGKFPNTRFLALFYMPQSDEFVVLQFEDTTSCGFLIVNLEFSTVESGIKFPKNTVLRIENLSKSNFYLNVNGNIQIFAHPTGQLDIGLSRMPWPSYLTSNDRYLIGPKPISNKPSDSNKNAFNLRVMNAGTGEVVCHLSMNMPIVSMLANVRNESLFVGTKSHGIIVRFDIGQISKKDAKNLKGNLELKLNEQTGLTGDFRECIGKFYPNIKVTKFHLSVDERFLISEYNFNDCLRAFGLWNIGTKTLVLGQMVDLVATVSFSVDGQYLYYIQRNGSLNIVNLQTSIELCLVMKEIPEQIYMLRGGSLFISFPKSIKLTTLKALQHDYGNPDNSQPIQPENFCTLLQKPKVSNENIVIFSNYEESSSFLYFKLASNSVSWLDISHTNESLTEYSTDRFMSPDGGKLLLVFGFKLANLMITDQEYDIDTLMIQPGPNGQLIAHPNDYRKPQIPRQNYFTGRDSTKPNQNKAAYNQKIVKVIDLKSMKTFFQVSLSGEEIFKFTDTILLTFKPDYASLTKNSQDAFDIVSVYDIIDARFISSLHLEHPVIDSSLDSSDNSKLLVCCGSGGKLLKLLGGKYFSTVLYEINVQTMLRYYDEFARSSAVTRMFTFPDNKDSVLLQFSWLDISGSVKVEKDTYYAKIDVNKKEIVCQFMSQGKVTDVASDGSSAIDSLLNIYDLQKGNIQKNLQVSIDQTDGTNTTCYTSLFSRDINHIVVLDPGLNCIWVIKNDELGHAVGKALLTSSFQDDLQESKFKIELALGGQLVIAHNDREFKIFVIKISQTSAPYEINYKTIGERIRKILLP